jgi:hypothetical protein
VLKILATTVQNLVTWETRLPDKEICGSNTRHLILSEQVIAQTQCTSRHLIKIRTQEMHSTIFVEKQLLVRPSGRLKVNIMPHVCEISYEEGIKDERYTAVAAVLNLGF